MVRLGRLQSVEGEYFLYRRASKFVSEVLVVLSSIVGLSSIGIIVGLGIELKNWDSRVYDDLVPSKDKTFALFIYTIVILIVSISDVVFALILHSGIRQLKISYCLFWRGATLTSLLVSGFLTLAFITMVHDLIPLLGYLPSLVSKPFAVWMINAFITELNELRTFPCNTVNTGEVISHPPAKPTFSLDDLEGLKNSTTVFYMNQGHGGGKPGRYSSRQYIVTPKLKPIPE